MATAKTAAPKKTGTALAVAKPTLPANIQDEMAKEMASFKERLSAPGGDRIKPTKKGFELPNGDTADTLRAIIVDFVSFNAYYKSTYNPNSIEAPECFAIGLEPTGMEPSENSKDKQCDTCTACWANQWKSGNGNGKACGNSKLIALIEPDGDLNSPLMLLKVSATAIKNFDSYVAQVARTFNRPSYGVVTEITLDPNLDYPSVRFGDPQPCDKDQLALAFARKEEARQRLLTEPDFSSLPEAAAAPARGKGQLQKPAARGRKAA